MSRIIVTGSNGFIGSRIIESLSRKGHDLISVDSEIFLDKDIKGSLLENLEIVDPQVIFHVGACSNTLETNVQEMMLKNYEVTKWIADWCSRRDKALVFSSSAANYGTNGIYPSNLYGWSKYVAEDYVVKSGGIALRYFNVYGPGESRKGKMASFLFQAFENSRLGRPVKIFPGKPRRDFVYINDVVDANLFAMENYSRLKGRWYEVSTAVANEFETVLDLANFSYSITSEDDVPEGYQFFTCGNKDFWMPGWQPSYTLEAGIHEYICFLQNESKVNLQD